LNILYLSELLYPHGGGAELATYLWAKLAASSGLSVKVITNRFPGEPERTKQPSLEILRLPILQAGRSVKYSVLGRFDILISNLARKLFSWADVVCIPRFWYSAIPIAKGYGKSVITHLHDYAPICSLATFYDLSKNEICNSSSLCHPSCIMAHERLRGENSSQILKSSLLNLTIWRYARRLVELSDAVVCVSEAQRELIIAGMKSLERKCCVVHNPLPEVSEMKTGGRDLAYFGGPSPLKGFNVLRSARKLSKTMPRVHATRFDVARRDHMQNSSGGRIIFYGRLSIGGLDEIYGKIRTVLVPSVWAEPAPYVVAEALLRGRLLIASEVGGIPEQVSQCPGAFLFEPMDYQGLADLVDYVDELDTDTVADLAAKNREVFLARFSTERSRQAFLRVLDKITI
jgi:glycosyltransferase involved in cell wall biosynthesis